MIRKDMRYNTSFGAGILAVILILAVPFADTPSLAQVDGNPPQTYQLRANIALANSIAPETAKRYGIDQGPRNALVDVVVMRSGGSHETVPASVEVRAHNLAGQTLPVKMRATFEAGRTAYIGVYKFAPDEVVDFDVLARPENSNEELRARVREHFPSD
jgi:hypothetical protein